MNESPKVIIIVYDETGAPIAITVSAESSLISQSLTPTINPPLPPTNVIAVASTTLSGTVFLSFTIPSSDGGSPILGYAVTGVPGYLLTNGTISPITITGLIPGTPYTFTVHAINELGISAESAVSNVVIPVGLPDTATSIIATSGFNSASVSFIPPAYTGGLSIQNYIATSTPGNIVAGNVSSPIIVHGLADGISYTFTVHATNAIGNSVESVSSNAVIPTGLPGAPTSVVAI
jgi:hypothetical protein